MVRCGSGDSISDVVTMVWQQCVIVQWLWCFCDDNVLWCSGGDGSGMLIVYCGVLVVTEVWCHDFCTVKLSRPCVVQ